MYGLGKRYRYQNDPRRQRTLSVKGTMSNQPTSSAERGADSLQRLVSLPGQPLCKHYSGATPAHLTGDYTCQCLAGVSYELFPSDMERWPCRRRHILGREQAECSGKDYGSEIYGDVDAQVDEMAKRALRQANDPSSATRPNERSDC
jgi:hypothetical protein